MVAFNQIPTTLRVPVVAAEFDSSQAQQGASILAYRGLIIGQKLAAGAAAANSLVLVTSEADVIAAAGRGSMLHCDYMAWRASNKSTEVWLGVLADDGAAAVSRGRTPRRRAGGRGLRMYRLHGRGRHQAHRHRAACGGTDCVECRA